MTELQQLQAEILNVLEHPVQSSLVGDGAAQDRLRGLYLSREPVQLVEDALPDPPSDSDLVTHRLHLFTFNGAPSPGDATPPAPSGGSRDRPQRVRPDSPRATDPRRVDAEARRRR
jgi:hypothetical protein